MLKRKEILTTQNLILKPIEDSDKNFYEDNNDSNSLEESEGDDYEDKYDNNTETKQKDKLNDSFESECFIF